MASRTYPHLARAPIVEAVISLGLQPAANRTVADLTPFFEAIKQDYPHKQILMTASGKFRLDPNLELTETTPPQQYGIRLDSQDRKHVVLAQLESFSLSRLEPYETWENLCAEARRLWKQYGLFMEPASINRVAVRYINSLPIPRQRRDYRDYLTAPPDVLPRLSQTLMAFSTQVVIPLPDLDAIAIIKQFTTDPTPETQPVVLDIDVSKEVNCEPGSDEAWNLLTRFREAKNRIFFESITELMESLCK